MSRGICPLAGTPHIRRRCVQERQPTVRGPPRVTGMVTGGWGALCDKHNALLSDDAISALRNSIADGSEKRRVEIQVSGCPGHGGLSKSQDVRAGRDLGSEPGGVCLRVGTWDLGWRGGLARAPAHQEGRRDKGLTSSPSLSPALPSLVCTHVSLSLAGPPPGEWLSGKGPPQPSPFPNQREPAGVRRMLGTPGL